MIPDMNLKVSLMESDVSEVGGREAFCRKLSNYDICGGSHVLSQQPAGSAAADPATLLHTASILNCFGSEFELTKGRLCACTMHPHPAD